MWVLILFLRRLVTSIMQVYLTYFVINQLQVPNHLHSVLSSQYYDSFYWLQMFVRERLSSNKFCLQIIRNMIAGTYFTSFASFQINQVKTPTQITDHYCSLDRVHYTSLGGVDIVTNDTIFKNWIMHATYNFHDDPQT